MNDEPEDEDDNRPSMAQVVFEDQTLTSPAGLTSRETNIWIAGVLSGVEAVTGSAPGIKDFQTHMVDDFDHLEDGFE